MKPFFGERIGRMRDWLSVERQTGTVQNSTGELIEVWTQVYRIKGNMDFRERGSEVFEMALQLSPQTTCRCTVRLINDLTVRDRIKWVRNGQTHYYNIDSILFLEGNRYQLLELQETERDVIPAT